MTPPVNVLVVHPSAELYGSDRVVLESVGALVEAGCAVHTVLGDDGPLRSVIEDAGSTVTVTAMPVLRKSLLSPLGLLRLVGGALRGTPAMLRLLARRRPSIVYVSTVTVPWWLLVARVTGARVVCHVHEAEESVPRVLRLALAAPLLLAHVVVANSERSRSVVVADLPALRSRVRVVYNGVPGPLHPHEPRPVLDGPVQLALVGRLSPRKGTDVAVAALDHLAAAGVEAELDIVGGVFPGYEWFERDVRASVERAGRTAGVRWHGVRPDVWGVLAGADVVLVPSRVEPFGNAAVEAMLAGRPVVAGDTQGLREIVRHDDNGLLVAPGDPVALADAVIRSVQDWPAALRRADRARAEAVVRFSPDRYRAQLREAVLGTPADLTPTALDPDRHVVDRQTQGTPES